MAKVPVPTRPTLDDEDYRLGGAGWIDRFGQNTDTTRREAETLGQTGKLRETQALDAQGRRGPSTDFGRSQQVGGQQVGAADWLTNFANGPQGPSAAQALLRQGANEAEASNFAAARSGSGFGESANSLRDAMRANSNISTTAANQAAQLRANEDQQFRQQQLGAMGTAADIYGAGAAREGEQAQFRTQSQLESQQMRDAMQLGLGQQGIDARNMGVQGAIAAEGMDLDAQRAQLEGNVAQGQTNAALYGTDADVFGERLRRDEALHEQRRKDRGEAAGTIGTVAAAAASLFSDERTKKNIKHANLRSRYAALSD